MGRGQRGEHAEASRTVHHQSRRVLVALAGETAAAASALFSASQAARCTASHGIGSHAEAVVLVGECSFPLL